MPFKISGGTRIDDTPMHEALREALANCLINADYFGSRGIVVTLQARTLTFANPGYSRTGKIQMLRGGVSDPRNRGLMKMFNLIDIGERAGSGIPKIVNIWSEENLKTPVIDEEFDPDRTILTLSLEKKQAITFLFRICCGIHKYSCQSFPISKIDNSSVVGICKICRLSPFFVIIKIKYNKLILSQFVPI